MSTPSGLVVSSPPRTNNTKTSNNNDNNNNSYNNKMFLSNQQRVQIYGIDCGEDLTWRGWVPGGDYAKKLVVRNASSEVKKVRYELPATQFFHMEYPKSITISPGMSFTVTVNFRPVDMTEYVDFVEFRVVTATGSHGSSLESKHSGSEVAGGRSRQVDRFCVPVRALLPRIAVQMPRAVSVGPSAVAEVTTTKFTMRNQGDIATRCQWTCGAPFTMVPPSVDLAPGASCSIRVEVRPTSAGTLTETASCRVSSIPSPDQQDGQDAWVGHVIGEGARYAMKLSTTARFAHLSLSKSRVNFGSVLTSAARSEKLLLTNDSGVDATFSIAQVLAHSRSRVASIVPRHGAVKAGTSLPVTVYFAPKASGVYTCEHFRLKVRGGNTVPVEVTGQSIGPSLQLTSNIAYFKDAPVGHYVYREIGIANTSRHRARFNFLNDQLGVFNVTPSCGEVGPETTRRVAVRFCARHPINYYVRCFVLVEHAAPLVLDLLGTGYSVNVRPALLTPTHISQHWTRCAMNRLVHSMTSLEVAGWMRDVGLTDTSKFERRTQLLTQLARQQRQQSRQSRAESKGCARMVLPDGSKLKDAMAPVSLNQDASVGAQLKRSPDGWFGPAQGRNRTFRDIVLHGFVNGDRFAARSDLHRDGCEREHSMRDCTYRLLWRACLSTGRLLGEHSLLVTEGSQSSEAGDPLGTSPALVPSSAGTTTPTNKIRAAVPARLSNDPILPLASADTSSLDFGYVRFVRSSEQRGGGLSLSVNRTADIQQAQRGGLVVPGHAGALPRVLPTPSAAIGRRRVTLTNHSTGKLRAVWDVGALMVGASSAAAAVRGGPGGQNASGNGGGGGTGGAGAGAGAGELTAVTARPLVRDHTDAYIDIMCGVGRPQSSVQARARGLQTADSSASSTSLPRSRRKAQPDAPPLFDVVPREADLLPGASVTFEVHFRPTRVNFVFAQMLQCFVFLKSNRSFRLVDKEAFVPPVCVRVNVSGHTFAPNSEPLLPNARFTCMTGRTPAPDGFREQKTSSGVEMPSAHMLVGSRGQDSADRKTQDGVRVEVVDNSASAPTSTVDRHTSGFETGVCVHKGSLFSFAEYMKDSTVRARVLGTAERNVAGNVVADSTLISRLALLKAFLSCGTSVVHRGSRFVTLGLQNLNDTPLVYRLTGAVLEGQPDHRSFFHVYPSNSMVMPNSCGLLVLRFSPPAFANAALSRGVGLRLDAQERLVRNHLFQSALRCQFNFNPHAEMTLPLTAVGSPVRLAVSGQGRFFFKPTCKRMRSSQRLRVTNMSNNDVAYVWKVTGGSSGSVLGDSVTGASSDNNNDAVGGSDLTVTPDQGFLRANEHMPVHLTFTPQQIGRYRWRLSLYAVSLEVLERLSALREFVDHVCGRADVPTGHDSVRGAGAGAGVLPVRGGRDHPSQTLTRKQQTDTLAWAARSGDRLGLDLLSMFFERRVKCLGEAECSIGVVEFHPPRVSFNTVQVMNPVSRTITLQNPCGCTVAYDLRVTQLLPDRAPVPQIAAKQKKLRLKSGKGKGGVVSTRALDHTRMAQSLASQAPGLTSDATRTLGGSATRPVLAITPTRGLIPARATQLIRLTFFAHAAERYRFVVQCRFSSEAAGERAEARSRAIAETRAAAVRRAAVLASSRPKYHGNEDSLAASGEAVSGVGGLPQLSFGAALVSSPLWTAEERVVVHNAIRGALAAESEVPADGDSGGLGSGLVEAIDQLRRTLLCVNLTEKSQRVGATGGATFNATLPHAQCIVDGTGGLPFVQVVDAREDFGSSASLAFVWARLQIARLNRELCAPLTSMEVLLNRHTLSRGKGPGSSLQHSGSIDAYRASDLIKVLPRVTMSLGNGVLMSDPVSYTLTFRNTGALPVSFAFKAPDQMEVAVEDWANTADPTMRQRWYQTIADRRLFTITPPEGTLPPGQSVRIRMTYYHVALGAHEYPVVLHVDKGKQIGILLRGQTFRYGILPSDSLRALGYARRAQLSHNPGHRAYYVHDDNGKSGGGVSALDFVNISPKTAGLWQIFDPSGWLQLKALACPVDESKSVAGDRHSPVNNNNNNNKSILSTGAAQARKDAELVVSGAGLASVSSGFVHPASYLFPPPVGAGFLWDHLVHGDRALTVDAGPALLYRMGAVGISPAANAAGPRINPAGDVSLQSAYARRVQDASSSFQASSPHHATGLPATQLPSTSSRPRLWPDVPVQLFDLHAPAAPCDGDMVLLFWLQVRECSAAEVAWVQTHGVTSDYKKWVHRARWAQALGCGAEPTASSQQSASHVPLQFLVSQGAIGLGDTQQVHRVPFQFAPSHPRDFLFEVCVYTQLVPASDVTSDARGLWDCDRSMSSDSDYGSRAGVLASRGGMPEADPAEHPVLFLGGWPMGGSGPEWLGRCAQALNTRHPSPSEQSSLEAPAVSVPSLPRQAVATHLTTVFMVGRGIVLFPAQSVVQPRLGKLIKRFGLGAVSGGACRQGDVYNSCISLLLADANETEEPATAHSGTPGQPNNGGNVGLHCPHKFIPWGYLALRDNCCVPPPLHFATSTYQFLPVADSRMCLPRRLPDVSEVVDSGCGFPNPPLMQGEGKHTPLMHGEGKHTPCSDTSPSSSNSAGDATSGSALSPAPGTLAATSTDLLDFGFLCGEWVTGDRGVSEVSHAVRTRLLCLLNQTPPPSALDSEALMMGRAQGSTTRSSDFSLPKNFGTVYFRVRVRAAQMLPGVDLCLPEVSVTPMSGSIPLGGSAMLSVSVHAQGSVPCWLDQTVLIDCSYTPFPSLEDSDVMASDHGFPGSITLPGNDAASSLSGSASPGHRRRLASRGEPSFLSTGPSLAGSSVSKLSAFSPRNMKRRKIVQTLTASMIASGNAQPGGGGADRRKDRLRRRLMKEVSPQPDTDRTSTHARTSSLMVDRRGSRRSMHRHTKSRVGTQMSVADLDMDRLVHLAAEADQHGSHSSTPNDSPYHADADNSVPSSVDSTSLHSPASAASDSPAQGTSISGNPGSRARSANKPSWLAVPEQGTGGSSIAAEVGASAGPAMGAAVHWDMYGHTGTFARTHKLQNRESVVNAQTVAALQRTGQAGNFRMQVGRKGRAAAVVAGGHPDDDEGVEDSLTAPTRRAAAARKSDGSEQTLAYSALSLSQRTIVRVSEEEKGGGSLAAVVAHNQNSAGGVGGGGDGDVCFVAGLEEVDQHLIASMADIASHRAGPTAPWLIWPYAQLCERSQQTLSVRVCAHVLPLERFTVEVGLRQMCVGAGVFAKNTREDPTTRGQLCLEYNTTPVSLVSGRLESWRHLGAGMHAAQHTHSASVSTATTGSIRTSRSPSRQATVEALQDIGRRFPTSDPRESRVQPALSLRPLARALDRVCLSVAIAGSSSQTNQTGDKAALHSKTRGAVRQPALSGPGVLGDFSAPPAVTVVRQRASHADQGADGRVSVGQAGSSGEAAVKSLAHRLVNDSAYALVRRDVERLDGSDGGDGDDVFQGTLFQE